MKSKDGKDKIEEKSRRENNRRKKIREALMPEPFQ